MKTEIRTITPKVATQMLKRNTGNRKLTESHMRFLSSEMKKGNWLFDGQPIRLTSGGAILDGQHRLNAVVNSGTSQKFLIVSGIPTSSFKVMDTGKVRSGSDVLSIKGYDNYAQLSAAVKFILSHNLGNNSDGSATNGSNKISNSDILNFAEATPGLKDIMRESNSLYKSFNKVLPSSQIGAYKYLFNQKDVVKSKSFWDEVCNGLGLVKGSPAKVLRDRLLKDKIDKTSLPSREKKALVIKAWNAYRQGKDIKFLRWNKESEKFPEII